MRQATASAKKEFKRPIPNVSCEVYQGGDVTLALGDTFADGTQLKDAFTQQVVTVQQGKVTLTPAKSSGGLVLLEPVKAKSQPFTYRNANT